MKTLLLLTILWELIFDIPYYTKTNHEKKESYIVNQRVGRLAVGLFQHAHPIIVELTLPALKVLDWRFYEVEWKMTAAELVFLYQ